jgi:glucose/arabinose dehydrogenase
MRPTFIIFLGCVACGSSNPDTMDGSNPDMDGGGGGGDGTMMGTDGTMDPDNYVPPTAMGDPCRGTAIPDMAHYTPMGLCARALGTFAGGMRQIMFTSNGDLYGVTSGGSIRMWHDANMNGVIDMGEVSTWGSTGGNGSNAHIDEKGGFLYAGTPGGVRRYPWTAGATMGGAGQDVVTGQPGGGNHPLHTVHVYGGYLYVHSGSSGNASNDSNPGTSTYDTTRSLLRRFDLSKFMPGTPFAWNTGEIYSQGLRNMVGYTQNAAGRMYGVVNGLDDIHYQNQDVHNDNPGEQLVQLGMGKHFGYPFCFTAQRVVVNNNVVAPLTQLRNQDYPINGVDDNWCAMNSDKPATFFQAHSAPLDITFFDSQPMGNLPEKYRGGAFVAFHGSWDRGPATGYKVVWVPFDSQGNSPAPTSTTMTTTFPYEVILGAGTTSGPTDGAWNWSANNLGENPRPTSVAVGPIDGSLYIASDSGGMLYRVGIQK